MSQPGREPGTLGTADYHYVAAALYGICLVVANWHRLSLMKKIGWGSGPHSRSSGLIKK